MSMLTIKSTGEMVDTDDAEALVAVYEAAKARKATEDGDMVAVAEAMAPHFGPLDRTIRVGKLEVTINAPTKRVVDPAELRELLGPLVSEEVLNTVARPLPQSFKVSHGDLTKLRGLDDQDVTDAIDLASKYEPQNRRLSIKAIKPTEQAPR